LRLLKLQTEPTVYLNGRFVPKSRASISIFDHGLLYGDGVFEGIRAYNGLVFQLAEHIDRLFDSANYLQLTIPLSKIDMSEAILDVLRRNNLRDAYIRAVVTRGSGDLGIDPKFCKEPSLFIIAEPVKNSFESAEPRVIAVIISSIRRDGVDATTHEVKSLNYLNSILARLEATDAGADDSIMLDSRGFISEATVTNVFLVKDGVVYTPQTSSAILRGVSRQRMIKLCHDLGLQLIEKDLTPFDLISANEVFLVGTKSEILAVGKVKGHVIGKGQAGPITKKVLREFVKLTASRKEGTPIYEEKFPGSIRIISKRYHKV
jgi:branched-chain amino acid aminotransferase